MSTSQFPLLWYTSGSPINVGQHECSYARWLGNHAGPHGTGYRARSTAVPLATGSAVHKGMELLGGWILDWQTAHPGKRLISVPDDVVAWAASEAAEGYARKAHSRGLELTQTDVTVADAVNLLIREQQTLIEAQVWVYAIVRLPMMLATRRLLAAEAEESPVIDCTCGLGDWIGLDTDHAARGCRGIVAQGKTDLLWEIVDHTAGTPGTIEYEEFKTKATPNYGWEQQWEHSGQLFRNMEAASKRLGREVSQAYVPVLFKGKRDRFDRDDKTSPKSQQSPLVYGWYDPGNGMNREPEWSARYWYQDEWGKNRRLGNTFKRTPIWDESVPLTGPVAANHTRNPNGVLLRKGASRVEMWVKGWITPIQHSELIKVLGPFDKPRALVGAYQQAMLTNERRWRSEVEYARAQGLFEPQDVAEVIAEVHEDGQSVMQRINAADIFARSWACTRFDSTRCSFYGVCRSDEGGDQPMLQQVKGDGATVVPRFEIRTPHHAPEKVAVEALGVVFPESDDEEIDE